MRPGVALLAWVAVALAGCSGPQAPAGPNWTEVVVPGNHMLDLEYDLPSGVRLHWQWETDGEARLAFQALFVTERGTAYPLASEYGSAGQGERTTPQSGRYDLTWDNQGAQPITVRYVVEGGYRQAVWPPGQGPGCAPLVLLQC